MSLSQFFSSFSDMSPYLILVSTAMALPDLGQESGRENVVAKSLEYM